MENNGAIQKPSSTKVSKSCDHCKVKKIKCDQKKPECENCQRYGACCAYSVMKKPGLKSGYGQQVFERIERLDKFIEDSKEEYESETRRLSQHLKDLEEKINLMQEQSNSMSVGASSSSREDVSTKITIGELTNPVRDFPEPFMLERIVEVYFDSINPLFPVLHPVLDRQTLLADLSPSNVLLLGVIISSINHSYHLISFEQAVDFDSIKSMIISRCFCIRKIEELKAMALLAFALYSKANDQECWSAISLAVGGCLHLGITKDLSMPLVEDETDDTTKPQLDWELWASKETSRHLVWQIYILDRLSSMGSHFSSKLPEDELTLVLPLNSEFWRKKNTFDKNYIDAKQKRTLNDTRSQPFQFDYQDLYSTNSYIIEVVHLMSLCLEFRRNPMDIKDMKSILSWQLNCYEFEKKIQSWLHSLPQSVSNFLQTGAFEAISTTVEEVNLFSLYHIMLIRLHSPTAFSNFPDKYLISSQVSKPKCLKSVYLMLRLSEKLPQLFQLDEKSTYQMMGPVYSFAIWVCGRVVLVNSIHSREPLDSDLDLSIMLLRLLGENWDCANKYANILEFFKEDAMNVDVSSNDVTPESEFFSSTHSEDTRLIADIKLNASTLDALLSKRVIRFNYNKGPVDELSIFDWFKLPINENFLPK